MRVLLLGGTGAMGVHLVEILAKNRIETVVTSRKKQTTVLDYVKYIQADAMDISSIDVLLNEKWDAIVDFMVYKTSSFNERFKSLLNCTEQYIFLSSARVYADSRLPISELSPRLLETSNDKEYLASDEYAISKARQEDILIESGRRNWTIIRPYITYSKSRLQLGVLEKEAWLYRALKGRSIVFSKDILSRTTTLTYGFDVAYGIFKLLGRSSALGDVFHITGPNQFTWNKILDIYLDCIEEHTGIRPKVCLLEMEKFIQTHNGNFQILYDRIYDRVFDSSKIYKYLDSENFMSTEAGLRSSVKSFLVSASFQQIDWKLEAKRDRFSQEHTSFSEITGFKNMAKYLVYRYFFRNK